MLLKLLSLGKKAIKPKKLTSSWRCHCKELEDANG